MTERILSRELTEYGYSDMYPYHMPGHKRRVNGFMPKDLFRMDITEIDGFDNLHQSEGILKEIQERAASLYGADETFYLVNGSTCGILSAISAAVPENGHILMARNCHKSAYHAAYLRRLNISYLYPEVMGEYDICEAVTAEQVREALDRAERLSDRSCAGGTGYVSSDCPDGKAAVDAVLIVSPTYEGRIADVEAIARVVHGRGIPLIVDEAHGAHLGFYEGFAQNSCQAGADLVIHSVHKTLPALTQTALLHVNGERIDRGRLRRFLHIYQSSSPSYILMASIDQALWQVEHMGGKLFGEFVCSWRQMMERLSACRHLRCLPSEDGRQDIGKLVISVKRTCMSGRQLYDCLSERYQLQLEMASPSYVLAMFTVGDDREGYERMTQALLEIDAELETGSGPVMDGREERIFSEPDDSGETAFASQTALRFTDAWDMKQRFLPLEECAGSYVGEFINLYPPGTPMAVPGEVITSELIRQIQDCLKKGCMYRGCPCRMDDHL